MIECDGFVLEDGKLAEERVHALLKTAPAAKYIKRVKLIQAQNSLQFQAFETHFTSGLIALLFRPYRNSYWDIREVCDQCGGGARFKGDARISYVAVKETDVAYECGGCGRAWPSQNPLMVPFSNNILSWVKPGASEHFEIQRVKENIRQTLPAYSLDVFNTIIMAEEMLDYFYRMCVLAENYIEPEKLED